MDLIYLDGMIRGGAAALLLLLSLLFAREARRSLTARLGMFLTLGGASYLSLVIIPVPLVQSWWRFPLHMCSLATPGLFWLFASNWFDDDFEIGWGHWLLLGVSAVAGLFHTTVFQLHSGFGAVTGLFWRGISLGMTLLGLWAALRGRSGDLLESRRKVRLAIAIGIGLIILSIILSELPLVRWPPPIGWRLVNGGSLLLLAGFVTLAMLGWRDPALLAPPVRPTPSSTSAPEVDDAPLLAQVQALMARDRLHRQEGLTITTVAARLGVPEYRLRRAINQGSGARNFNAFLNGYRLEEAKAALADPAQREVPILTIALDSGFGSLAPFNRAFKQATALTPTEFRLKMLGSSQ
jgi:AraC-like DNA-binding protein